MDKFGPANAIIRFEAGIGIPVEYARGYQGFYIALGPVLVNII